MSCREGASRVTLRVAVAGDVPAQTLLQACISRSSMSSLNSLREHDGIVLELGATISEQLAAGVRRLVAEAVQTKPSDNPSPARDDGPMEGATSSLICMISIVTLHITRQKKLSVRPLGFTGLLGCKVC